MKFSFIIPVYNCGSYLPECIERICELKLDNYEIILIDDGSTDDSAYICDSIATENRNVICIHQKNQGVSKSRNRGLDVATGEYIIFLDADDTVEPTKLRKILYKVEMDPFIDLVIYGISFDYYYHGKCYRQEFTSYPTEQKMKRSEWLPLLKQMYLCNAISPIWNKVIRRQLLVEHQIRFQEDMFLYEDLEFSIRVLACCNIIYNFSGIVYHYRQSEDEGKVGRRLLKLNHISDLVERIEGALNALYMKNNQTKAEGQKILLLLYLTLAREKISVSKLKDIRQICDDFAKWMDGRNIEIPEAYRKFVTQLLGCKMYELILNREYCAIRHKIAIKLKSIGVLDGSQK